MSKFVSNFRVALYCVPLSVIYLLLAIYQLMQNLAKIPAKALEASQQLEVERLEEKLFFSLYNKKTHTKNGVPLDEATEDELTEEWQKNNNPNAFKQIVANRSSKRYKPNTSYYAS